ncbi:MAG: hypothetical protein ACXVNF_01705 [Neobacillus sp.]
MDIEIVWRNIRKMEGFTLKSIREGRDIKVISVNEKRIKVELQSGTTKSWPFHKIKQLVDAMSTSIPVHVDSILGGGGSSRNIPETILANLSDVEHLDIEEKKHIVWVKVDSHNLGSTKEVEQEHIEKYRIKLMQAEILKHGYAVVFCSDLSSATTFYENAMKAISARASSHTILKSAGAAVILRLATEEFLIGKTIPLMIVDNIDEYIKNLRKYNVDFRYKKIRGDLSLPDQILVSDKSGLTIMISEPFE